MGNSTRSSQRTSDDKGNGSEERQNTANRLSNSTAGLQDATSLRRSQRQTALQKSTPSPPSTRKSGRLEKQDFKSPPAKRKLDSIVNPKKSSPLRRSNRFKMAGSRRSLRSSDIPDTTSKKKKSVMRLTMETEEVREEDEQQSNSSPEEKWRMNARTYRAFVRKLREASGKDENGGDGHLRVDKNSHIQELEYSSLNMDSHHSIVDAEPLLSERENQVTNDSHLVITSNEIHATNADISDAPCCRDNGEHLSQAPTPHCTRQRIDHTQVAFPDTKLDPVLNRSSTVKEAGAGESQRGTIAKGTQLFSGVSLELYSNCEIVNKLNQYKGRKAIMFDDQERVKKVICFIASLANSSSQPFLIISSALTLWEKGFLHLVPSMNIMVFIGNKEIRQSTYEQKLFEGGRMIPQVLLTSPEVVNEDLHLLNCIQWEVVVVDECQSPKISSQFKQFKTLHTSTRLLLASGQLQGGVTEFRSVLSLLEPDDLNNSDNLLAASDMTICDLKERLAKYAVYESKLDTSRFIEYWVPAYISNVQLEQYCATLLSNSLSLRSSSRSDPVGTLREILVTTWKCCDHPYIVDGSLQTLLAKDRKEVEYLDIGIKASGKLQLLDVLLADMKTRGLRVLILFQSLGGSGILVGDILDDFVRQRFGQDCYERIDSGVIPSKKQCALNKFNKEKGRFIFLLEKRACLPSIKLSSVDAIILFDTDWNPMNDVRSLQRITLNSPVEKIKLFRLYSAFTVEEKLLIFAKQDKHLDSNVQNISPNTSHTLLMWRADHLFKKLDEFHSCLNPVIDAPEDFHLKNVVQELQRIFSQTEKDGDSMQLSLISQANGNQGTYTTNLQLLGEQKIQEMSDLPNIFWTKLLEGRQPLWRFSSSSTPRNRKRPQYFAHLHKPEAENAEAAKKRKKIVNDKIDTDHLQLGLQGQISSKTDTRTAEPDEKQKMYDSQTCLHVILKPELAELCEVFSLSEDIKLMAERLLEYFINNHHINREPETILQAFQISLCWTAASLLKCKMDHKESLILARKHLKYSCTKEEVDYVYSLLRCLRGIFVHRMKRTKNPDFSQSTEASGAGGVLGIQGPDAKNALSDDMLEFQLVQRDLSTSIKDIKRKCDKKMEKLLQKQRLEEKEFNRKYEEEKAKLEQEKKAAAAVLINIYGNSSSMTSDKLKKSESEYSEKFGELEQKREAGLKELEAVHLAAKDVINERKAFWVEALKSFVEVELVNQPSGQTPLLEVSTSKPKHSMSVAEAQSSDSHPIAPEKEVSIGSAILPLGPIAEDVPVTSSCDHGLTNAEFFFKQHADFRPDGDDQVGKSAALSWPSVHGDVHSARDSPKAHICHESSIQGAERVGETIHSSDGPDSLVISVPYLSSAEVTNEAAVSSPGGDGDASLGISETVGSIEGHGSVVSPIVEQAAGEDAHTLVNGSASGKVTEAVISRDDSAMPDIEVDETVSTFPREGSASEATLNVPDGDAPLRTTNGAVSSSDKQKSVSENPPSDGQISPACVTENGGPELLEDIVPSDAVKDKSAAATSACSFSGLVPSVETEIALNEMSMTVDTYQTIAREIGGSTCQRSDSGEQLPLQEVPQDLGSLPLTSSEVQHEDASTNRAPITEQVPEPSGSRANADTAHCQTIQAPVIELHEDMQDLISGGGLGSRTVPVTLSTNTHPMQSADAVSFRAPIPLYHDPLQTEMERISKEKDNMTKAYEEAKVHMKSEFEKEMEEVLAQIRVKYEAKCKEKESEYLIRKKELDSNFYQVSMNKILAEAFRFKCMDSKASAATGLPQDASFVQLLVQQHQNAPRPATPGLATPQAMAPNRISSALSYINSFPSSGNLPVGIEVRAPAPHLQVLRPSAPFPASSSSPHPRVMSTQMVPTNPLVPSTPLTYSSSMPFHHAVPATTTQSGGTHLSQSAVIVDASTRSSPYLPIELGSNLPRSTQPQFVTPNPTLPGTRQINPNPNPNLAQASEAADIVCISDDDD